MQPLVYTHGTYHTEAADVSMFARHFPSGIFYGKLLVILVKAAVRAKWSRKKRLALIQSSLEVLRALERVGVTLEIRGIEHVTQEEEPCVFIANHMSTLETLVLPGLIQPLKEVTFVVKDNLLHYPVFQHICRAWNPIAVTRQHPRQDYNTVLEEGLKRLQAGESIIVFPQTTRTTSWEPTQFNSIGIKLARKADVPVIPMGLRTDAWANGKYLKECGKIDPAKQVVFAFGEPFRIQGQGKQEHAAVMKFIQATLTSGRDMVSGNTGQQAEERKTAE
ncbi:1-acyl-sn-glycerol-3-phosphate acyltransferase [candidate division KSB3 bacterium]|uniref:1-acyl-sn-glycerol-3-phosphate acyltransferase n=1 Tax=candidate division KSB3 bacterium TaxID=2044937 RepID=A0A9D5Q7N7_9BACT|nr:1-acyl-sn-glycerol-3-phosphate acyltransferase [candidate division KSB3 bacterium]MBD3326638.1 1-acyl-sn-glycerol-3-phosphate acyltransferase [candidate division KSB3 bacterium]